VQATPLACRRLEHGRDLDQGCGLGGEVIGPLVVFVGFSQDDGGDGGDVAQVDPVASCVTQPSYHTVTR